MTKQEFVDRVAQKANIGRREAGEAVDAVIESRKASTALAASRRSRPDFVATRSTKSCFVTLLLPLLDVSADRGAPYQA